MSFESTQLVKCQVRNRDNQTSYRLIERQNYDLWRYLVMTKHHITIVDTSSCLWINLQEFTNKQDIYERAGEIEAANRLLLMMYDDHGAFSNTYRYALESDTADVQKILLGHIPTEQKAHNQYSLEIEKGYIVTTGPISSLHLTTDTEAV